MGLFYVWHSKQIFGENCETLVYGSGLVLIFFYLEEKLGMNVFPAMYKGIGYKLGKISKRAKH